jgi:hypothetical protein
MSHSSTVPPLPSGSALWDKVRTAFAKSIMVNTPLASLAQDLDVPPWPLKSADETPSAYIYLPHSQAVAALAARGLPPAQLGYLIAILRETTAFDEPFGEMMDDISAAPVGAIDGDSPLVKNMVRLGLPDNFPLKISALSVGTIELCRSENVETLGAFVTFASRLSQSVIVGGDFRELLNALAQKDEVSLARILPFRPGVIGLHFRETLVLAATGLATPARAAVIADPKAIPMHLHVRIEGAVVYFAAEYTALRQSLVAGGSLPQLFVGIPDPSLIPVIGALLSPHLPAKSPVPAVRRSFFQRLFGRS